MRLASIALLLLVPGCLSTGRIEQDQARRETYLTAHPETNREIADSVRLGEIRLGMTLAELEASLGKRLEMDVRDWDVEVTGVGCVTTRMWARADNLMIELRRRGEGPDETALVVTDLEGAGYEDSEDDD